MNLFFTRSRWHDNFQQLLAHMSRWSTWTLADTVIVQISSVFVAFNQSINHACVFEFKSTGQNWCIHHMETLAVF